MKALTREELRGYMEAQKQKICEKYGEVTDRTIRRFVEGGDVESFHDEYFGRTIQTDSCS